MELIIGLGESGSNIAIEYAEGRREDNKIIVFNTALTDLNKIKSEKVTKVTVGEGQGSGRNPRVTMDLFRNNKDKLKKILVDKLQKEIKVIKIFAGLGGGTGAGSLPTILEIINEISPTTINYTIMVMPLLIEGNPTCSNSLALLDKIYEDYVMKGYAIPIIINNDNYRKYLGKNSETWKKVNMEIINVVTKITDFTNFTGTPKRNGMGSVDYNEFKRVIEPDINCAGCLGLFHYNFKKDTIESVTIPYDISKGKKAVVLFKTTRGVKHKYLEALNNKVRFFKIIGESEAEGKETCEIIINGLTLPEELLGQRLKRARKQIKGLKHKNKEKAVGKINADELLDL